MSDEHSGLSHDLPEYTPNWPVPVKVKAIVYKRGGVWLWSHECPRKGLARVIALGGGKASLPEAFNAALKHARGCW
ncbi:hypothetical protein AB0J81_13605 [Streptomyces bobili]|uniref:hypothetical protein n=1 Tax=Streptomyces bobili TaxID=67280 RepID=UPI0034154B67